MSPHAVPLSDGESFNDDTPERSPVRDSGNMLIHHEGENKSHLKRYGDDCIHDLICVGFGPASLAIAVALHDALDAKSSNLRALSPKVRFLERQSRFAWHAGMLLPGAKMQITFIKDLATLRNPRSEFTFLNYLHANDRLVDFTNLGTFLPQRIEYEDYMKWCAAWFEDVVDYGESVESIDAGQTNPAAQEIEYFIVTSRNILTGHITTSRAKNVVIASGGKPNIPSALHINHPRIIHSSQYATSIDRLFPSGQPPKKVAVIGAGQSAAEVFNNLPSKFPHAQVNLIIRGSALRPSDDSPFVNEIFNPSRTDDFYAQSESVRHTSLLQDKATNYSVVRLELLEHIYSVLYSYKIQYPNREEDWPQRILTHREVLNVENCNDDGIKITLRNDAPEYAPTRCPNQSQVSPFRKESSFEETLDVDLVVVATGYVRNAHEDLLANLRHLRSEPIRKQSPNAWSVSRNYSVEFASGAVQPGSGIWLQGCNEATHGLSDTLLSVLAVRGGEMVQSIFGA